MGWRTLIVEDEPVTIDVLRALLDADDRFEVVMALRDARWVVKLAGHAAPDIVVLDDQMSTGPSGLQALPELRAALPDALIVMHTFHDNAEQALSQGADAHINKEHELLEVVDLIAAAATERAARTTA